MVTLNDVIYRFWFTVNLCGCGWPDEVLAMVRDELERLDTAPGAEREAAPDTREHRLLAYVLDSWGLTEHGTSLGWPWLTDEGQLLLIALRSALDLGLALDAGSLSELHATPDAWEPVEWDGGRAQLQVGAFRVRNLEVAP